MVIVWLKYIFQLGACFTPMWYRLICKRLLYLKTKNHKVKKGAATTIPDQVILAHLRFSRCVCTDVQSVVTMALNGTDGKFLIWQMYQLTFWRYLVFSGPSLSTISNSRCVLSHHIKTVCWMINKIHFKATKMSLIIYVFKRIRV